MTSSEKLRLLLIRDTGVVFGFAASFLLPGIYRLVVSAVAVIAALLVGKKLLRVATPLEARQRRTYFGGWCLLVLICVALLFWWASQRATAEMWLVAGVGSVLLVAVVYTAYDYVYGANPKV